MKSVSTLITCDVHGWRHAPDRPCEFCTLDALRAGTEPPALEAEQDALPDWVRPVCWMIVLAVASLWAGFLYETLRIAWYHFAG